MNRNQKLWSVGIVITTILLFVAVGSLIDSHRKATNSSSSAGLNESGGPVAFTDPKNLPDILLSWQLNAFYWDMADFIQTQFGPSVQMKLTTNATIEPNGNVKMEIYITPSGKKFEVFMNRIASPSKITVSIPSYGYSKTNEIQ